MPIKTLLIIAYFLLIFGINGCYFDNEEELYPTTNCNTNQVTFSNTISPLITNSCATTGCHVAGTGRVLLTNYAEIKTVINAVEKRTITDKNMPPSGSLSVCDLSKLKKWIDEGVPNN